MLVFVLAVGSGEGGGSAERLISDFVLIQSTSPSNQASLQSAYHAYRAALLQMCIENCCLPIFRIAVEE